MTFLFPTIHDTTLHWTPTHCPYRTGPSVHSVSVTQVGVTYSSHDTLPSPVPPEDPSPSCPRFCLSHFLSPGGLYPSPEDSTVSPNPLPFVPVVPPPRGRSPGTYYVRDGKALINDLLTYQPTHLLSDDTSHLTSNVSARPSGHPPGVVYRSILLYPG